MGQENEMSFLDHLEELRWHVIKATAAIIVAATVAFLAKGFLFDVLIFGPTKPDFFTYEFLCNASRLMGFESFCDTNFDFEVQAEPWQVSFPHTSGLPSPLVLSSPSHLLFINSGNL